MEAERALLCCSKKPTPVNFCVFLYLSFDKRNIICDSIITSLIKIEEYTMHNDKILSKFDCERIERTFEQYNIANESEKRLIDHLKQQLQRSKHVDPRKIKSNIVTMNSKFILKNLGNGRKEEYHLVFPDDSDSKKKKISVISGIGAQVLGSTIGTVIKENSGSEQYYMIESIVYQPEAAGHYNL